MPSVLADRHDEISDPASLADVVALASRLKAARERNVEVCIPCLGGVEIALKGMLAGIGFNRVRLGGTSFRLIRVLSESPPTTYRPWGWRSACSRPRN